MPNSAAAMRPPAATAPSSTVTVPAAWLLGVVSGWLVLDLCLLWLFLGNAWLAALTALAFALVQPIVSRSLALGPIGVARVALCIAIAAAVLVLGGEGGWFYANPDWQVREAVLRDMALLPWPFAYQDHGGLFLLRAPLGMYLLPAVAWKAGGAAFGSTVLLAQNSVLIGLLLALGSQLFDGLKARAIALVMLVGFSGLDWVGNLLFDQGPLDHLEGWAPGLQYSSNITLAFWVPQHAFAGWLVGLAFMLHRAGKVGLAPFLALVPLSALWSPLTLMGALPWAALAGWCALRERTMRWDDLVLPALASLAAVPALAYMSAAGDSVGFHLYGIPAVYFLLFLVIEVLPWLIPVLALNARSRFGRKPALVSALVLIGLPHLQVGWSIDLMMRASIPSLAVLALAASEIVVSADKWTAPGWHWWLAAVAGLGWPTGAHEVARALTHPPVALDKCNLLELWNLTGKGIPNGTYVAPLGRVPHWLVGKPVTPVPVARVERCWDKPWFQPQLP